MSLEFAEGSCTAHSSFIASKLSLLNLIPTEFSFSPSKVYQHFNTLNHMHCSSWLFDVWKIRIVQSQVTIISCSHNFQEI
ncbi:hypothetical protein PRUPE_5G188600 [Prunus persica]|uniref:Uncharacterized protein n=1 Tax=Prunus persica TaxID=3760 RepID=A0A251PAJ4_PRUPE|nr:hypothetical protein PRUPE_5G188600 [Prunus persica]